MAPQIETLMLLGHPPWHGLVEPLPEDTVLSSEQVLQKGGLDWEVERAPIETADQVRTSVHDWRVIRRKTDQAILGVVPAAWQPIQNRQAMAIMDVPVSKGSCRYCGAGSLKGGSKVFIQAKMPDTIDVGGKDPVERYLLLSNPHDGGHFNMLFTPVRVVCANTLAMALETKGSADTVTRYAPRVSISHVAGNMKHQLKEGERIMARAAAYYAKFGEWANFLYGKQAESDVVQTILETVFPANVKDEVTPAIQEHRDAVEQAFTDSPGNDVEGVRGTAWALLNGFTWYSSHPLSIRSKQTKTPADRAYNVWMGSGKHLTEKAARVIGQVFV